MNNKKLIEAGNKALMPVYNRYNLVLKDGEGSYLRDIEGKKYLDFVGGIAVNSLGYNDIGLVNAIQNQAHKLLHVSNLYWTEELIRTSVALTEASELDRVFFCNSGAEAVEAAIKLARIYGKKYKSKKAVEIISMDDSFHGRTYAAITATGQPKYQKDIGPLVPNFLYANFNDLESLKDQITDNTCAILIEPVQGEGGIYPADQTYLMEVRNLCDEKNIVLIFDEVQCGVGRSGHFFAYQNYGVKPDIVCFAKGIAGGVPLGGILANEKCGQLFVAGTHGSTYGGNPLAMAAAYEVITRINNPEFLQDVREKGNYLLEQLNRIADKFPKAVGEIRGVGLMCGMEMKISTSDVIQLAQKKGLLIIGAGKNVIRFVPPLIITYDEIDEGMKILEESIISTTSS